MYGGFSNAGLGGGRTPSGFVVLVSTFAGIKIARKQTDSRQVGPK